MNDVGLRDVSITAGGLLMFRNYLASALGNLLKNKLFSFVNIVGLAMGLAACLVIALYVHNETS